MDKPWEHGLFSLEIVLRLYRNCTTKNFVHAEKFSSPSVLHLNRATTAKRKPWATTCTLPSRPKAYRSASDKKPGHCDVQHQDCQVLQCARSVKSQSTTGCQLRPQSAFLVNVEVPRVRNCCVARFSFYCSLDDSTELTGK